MQTADNCDFLHLQILKSRAVTTDALINTLMR